ncbi:hypothetical protein FRB90_006298 [Tulasnella sp. 427]|nr:hypothetical protein FRB90_006298 [Tulasnella sp. 427]
MAARKRTQEDEPEAANAQAKKALKAEQAKGAGSSKPKKPAPPPLPSDSPVKTRKRNPSARALEVIEAGRRQAEGRRTSPKKCPQVAKPKPTETFTFHEQQPPAPKKQKTIKKTTNVPTSAPVWNPASTHSKTTSAVPVDPPPRSGIVSATPAPSHSTFGPKLAQKLPMDLAARIYPPPKLGHAAKPMRAPTRRSPSLGKQVDEDDEDGEVDEDHNKDHEGGEDGEGGEDDEDDEGGEDDEDGKGGKGGKGGEDDEGSEDDDDKGGKDDDNKGGEDNEDEASNNLNKNYCIDYDNDDFAHGSYGKTFGETDDWDDIDGGTLQETGQRDEDEDEEEYAVRHPGRNTTTRSTRSNHRAGEGGNNGIDRDNHGNQNSAQPAQPTMRRSNNTSASEAEDRHSDDNETEEIPLDVQQEPRRRKHRSQRQADGEDSSHGDGQDSNKGSANRTLRVVALERREVVKLAFVRLRCFTATCKPFPSPEEESQMIDTAWKWVQDNYKEYADLQLLSHEHPVMQVYISNICGKIKTAA